MEQSGIIKRISPVQNVTDRLRKRELIIDIPGNYPQTVVFEAVNDKCDLLNSLQLNQSVTVHFNLNGREHNGRVYNTLSIWKVA